GVDRRPDPTASGPRGTRPGRRDVHRTFDIPAADRRRSRADRSDLVGALQSGAVRGSAPGAASGTEPGGAARRGYRPGLAQSLRSHGSADAASGANTVDAPGGDRTAQRTASREGGYSFRRRTRLVAEYRAG